jgi:predicted metal-dependent hydrolase
MRHRADANSEPAKEVRSWNGIPLNITTKSGEPRFSFAPPMSCDYGCIRGSWGTGLDGKALDVYVVSDAPTVFKVVQITPAGAIDEYKYVLGAQNFDEAVEMFLKHVPRQLFGAASQYSIAQLQDDIGLHSKVKKDADELTNFVEQLEELIESDDAYSSNINLISFDIADNGDISGKFQDAWNRRIFSYSVQENRIGYKPAIATTNTDSETDSKLFDVFSLGYTSLESKYDAVKSGKKPRCTAISYGCGSICIPLQHTCWINNAGQQTKRAGGSIESVSQGRIDKIRALAKYLDSKGNNKWSRYGTANDLKAKANTLEKERAGMFKAGVKKQPPIDPLIAGLKRAFDSDNFAEAKILARQAASKMKSGAEVATYLQKLSEVIGREHKLAIDKKQEITKKANEITITKGKAAARKFYSENWNTEVEEACKKYENFTANVAREFLYVNPLSKMKGVNGGLTNPKTQAKTGTLNQEQLTKLVAGINAFKKMVGVDTVNGKTLKVAALDATFGKAADRSFYGRGGVYMADKAPVEVVVHEAAHWLEESDPKIHDKVQKFFENRTAGEKWQKLSELTGNSNYSDNEVAKPDKWLKAYMGKKTNSDKNSEILSMGMEMMYKDPAGFARADPEYFAFIYNTLRGK